MKRILKLAARLYPSAWRRRYGAEYEALLEQGTPRVGDVFDVLWGAFTMQMTNWSFLRIVLVCSLGGAVVAVGISFVAPKKYLSQTLISVETPEPQPIDKYIGGLVKDLLSPEFLTSIIEREDLYPGEQARMPMSDVVNLMRKEIWIQPVQTSDGKSASAFVVRFIYPDPRVAQRVDKELASQLMLSNLRAAINSPAGASRIPMTFTVRDTADLPQKPIFPKRGVFGAGGLVGGLVGGLIVAVVVGWRRRLTVANG